MAPWPFKLTNLLLHFGSALLLLSIARQLGANRTGAVWGAALFAVHPLASEAVNTISGRSNLLMVFGLLVAVRCYGQVVQRRPLWLLGTLAAGALSLGSKEPAMILPVLLLVVELLHWLRAGPERERLAPALGRAALRVAPVVLLVIGYVYLRAHMLGAGSFGVTRWEGSNVHSGFTRGLATQLATMATLLPQALGQVLVPVGLTMDPSIDYTDDFSRASVLGGIALLVGVTGAGLWAPQRRGAPFFGTALAWGCALPWVVKPLNLPFLEHRLYGCLVGLGIAGAGSVRGAGWSTWRPVLRVTGVAVLALLAGMSARRSLEFRSEERLWKIELVRNPESRVAMAGTAVQHIEAGRFAAARPLLRKLVVYYPERRDARMNLIEAELHCVDGDLDAALRHAEHLVKVWDRNPFYRLLHSRVLAALGRRTGRVEHFDQAVAAALHCLEIAEPKGLVYRTAASARRLQGDLPAALRLLDRGVARGLDHSSVLLDRAMLREQVGDIAGARRDLLRARMGDPFNGRVLAALQRLRNRSPSAGPR